MIRRFWEHHRTSPPRQHLFAQMFAHGTREPLGRVRRDTGGFDQWVHSLAARAPRNQVIVATAKKLAHIAWVVLSSLG